jgi:hypothetical protein
MSLARKIRIKEDVRVEFRAEALNFLNRARFGALTDATQLQNVNFSLWRSQGNSPRRHAACSEVRLAGEWRNQ